MSCIARSTLGRREMTGKEHGNGWLWPLQARPYITLHHTLAVMSNDDNGKKKKEGNRKNP